MQYTTNYNLITVEGTDVVNPLVQMNPNFTDIDAAMFANKQASIGSATEITAGTVHSITRANTDSNYFRFTATSNWTAGDSMNIDGTSVSVYLTDGTTPGTGAYVINSEVFGILSGSRVTLYLASSPVTSLDADQVNFDPTGTSLSPSDTDVDKAIRELASGSVRITKLWENPNPSASSFGPQSITLSSSDYDMLVFDVNANYAVNYHSCFITIKGSNIRTVLTGVTGTTSVTVTQRTAVYTNDTTYAINDAQEQNSGSGVTVNNGLMIPIAVYGIKFS